ncbi:MAG: gamma carbonic anhydrase family protein [Proteobacteria bacterium]|nr:gamma carbonic anhydrase family protein [Pseudomonadota bacterium]
MALYELDGDVPDVDPSAYVAAEAVLIGKVTVGAGASIWAGVVIRGDNERITIGARSNVQEGTVMHTDMGFPLTVGEDVTIGHQAMLHGCTVEDGALIGIQAVVLNGAVIGSGCLVGAGALVTEGKRFGPRQMLVGSPARVARELTEAEAARLALGAAHYVARAQKFKTELRRVDGE